MAIEHARIRPFRVTNRLVLSIAIPMTLAHLTTPLLGIVDIAVVGQFGDPALLGGLAAGAIILDLIFTGFNFLRSGTTALVAQAFGADDQEEEAAVLWRAAVTSLLIGLAVILFSPLILAFGGWFMTAGDEVTAAMMQYVGIRILVTPVSLLNYALLGFFLGRGQSGVGFALQLLLNGTNIGLSVFLGLSLGWGVEGVAWATVIAELVAALCGAGLLLAGRKNQVLRLDRRRLLDAKALTRTFAINGDIMIRSLVLSAAFALFARAGAQLGDLQLAANAVLMNFFMLMAFMLDGLATAAEQLAGRAIGARYRPALERAVGLTAIWGFAIAAVLSAATLIFGEFVIAFVTTSPTVREVAGEFLFWAALTAISGVAAFQMDGVYIGATWSRDMRNMMLMSFAIFIAGLLLFTPVWGNHGIWAALHLFLLVRGATLYAIYPSRLKRSFAPTDGA